jgi:hypothetical protein
MEYQEMIDRLKVIVSRAIDGEDHTSLASEDIDALVWAIKVCEEHQ